MQHYTKIVSATFHRHVKKFCNPSDTDTTPVQSSTNTTSCQEYWQVRGLMTQACQKLTSQNSLMCWKTTSIKLQFVGENQQSANGTWLKMKEEHSLNGQMILQLTACNYLVKDDFQLQLLKVMSISVCDRSIFTLSGTRAMQVKHKLQMMNKTSYAIL